VYEDVLLPVLVLAAHDHGRGRVDGGEQRAVVDGVRELVEEAAAQAPPPVAAARAYGAPARHEADAVALRMLDDLLAASRVALDVVSPDMLSAEVVRGAREHGGDVVVVGAVAPGGLVHARVLCKRLRATVPTARIVVGRWGMREDAEATRRSLLAAGADAVGTSLLETRNLVLQYLPARAPARAGA
jgi:hypothetical protein